MILVAILFIQDILIYLERDFGVGCVNQVDNGSTVWHQPPNAVAKSPFPPSSSATDAPNLYSDANANALDPEETGEYDNAVFDMDVAQPTGLLSSNDLLRNPVDISVSSVYLKLKIVKIWFAYELINSQQA
jgi:CCR4-NOT transcription complex subunit 10